MPLSKELSEYIARYLRFANELREKAEKPQYALMRRGLLEVADEWAQIAAATAKEAEANDTPAKPQPFCMDPRFAKGGPESQ